MFSWFELVKVMPAFKWTDLLSIDKVMRRAPFRNYRALEDGYVVQAEGVIKRGSCKKGFMRPGQNFEI